MSRSARARRVSCSTDVRSTEISLPSWPRRLSPWADSCLFASLTRSLSLVRVTLSLEYEWATEETMLTAKEMSVTTVTASHAEVMCYRRKSSDTSTFNDATPISIKYPHRDWFRI